MEPQINIEHDKTKIEKSTSTSLSNQVHFKKSGPAVFGYMWKDGCLMLDENEAPIRKLMYDFFLKTNRKKTTATMLNNLGYRTRTGKLFSHTSINRLLQDPTAKGMYAIEHDENDIRETGTKEHFTYRQCPAIVSKDLWDACQQILKKSLEQKRCGPQTTYSLSGYIYCSCGRSMYVYHRNKYPAFRCRICKTKILVEDIEAIYHGQLHPFLFVANDAANQQLSYNVIKDEMSVYTKWNELPFATKRSVIEAITQKIIVFTNTIDIHFLKKFTASIPINVGKNERVMSFRIVNKYQIIGNKRDE
jgi:site-specific DNA recombinase